MTEPVTPEAPDTRHGLTPRSPCRLSRPGIVCPLGADHGLISSALFSASRGLRVSDDFSPGTPLSLGRVTARLVDDSDWPAPLRSRNNRLLATALEQLTPELEALKRQGIAPERIGVVLGTSTSGIGETEAAMDAQRAAVAQGTPSADSWPESFEYRRQELGAPAECVAWLSGARGPVYTLSTACTSSAKALASARRLLASGQCDAVIAGGADSLCHMTVKGFMSLEAVSRQQSQPLGAARDGINLGEAAVLFVVTPEHGGVQLTGVGESSDAHHISAPCPDGSGAEAAMRGALASAGRAPGEIDYINLHGTATPLNDAMESLAISRLFGPDGDEAANRPPAVSSTKALTGHTLGACGALEAAFCWLTLEHGRLPPHATPREALDPSLPALNIVYRDRPETPPLRVMSNAFAFGGNNISLILERHATDPESSAC
ncbi:beta-ketoacyl-ACP synthase [Cobetia marina]|jgi:3-oxoacyl-[acyl-carrier-protein] synthase-1|uniref:beta-ketoacyl-ACP synthase n=1 Tax=Cobetia TaxID=204286 RepID=UPI0022FE575B|nr:MULTISPECIES: beta-ketoacyl-ACP synthase [Cobetia]MDA5562454.1 beta-ketoacyl-ACP synthase [Cobetia sp. MMG027]MDH2291168.1 beta-ketoacyl-ACP synthase [Cobetia sp. 10Alg 146]MDO6786797.1 beta-ketoacyl-ACP synthase [Cobetia marina]